MKRIHDTIGDFYIVKVSGGTVVIPDTDAVDVERLFELSDEDIVVFWRNIYNKRKVPTIDFTLR